MAKFQETRVNGKIEARQVRLIDQDGQQHGIVDTRVALEMADAAELDLVEISNTDEGSVCKIMDFGKYRFELQKKLNEAKKKQKQIQLKEVKFRPGTDVGDYQVKLRNLIRFLEEGDKAKVTIRFRGREMAHQELGRELLNRIEADLVGHGQVEQKASMQGRQMTMVLGPSKKK